MLENAITGAQDSIPGTAIEPLGANARTPLSAFPSGIYRYPRTLQAIEFYLKLPEDLPERDVILCDPMVHDREIGDLFTRL